MINKPSPDNRPKKAVTLDDLADELFSSPEIHEDLAHVQVREVKPQLMRWVGLGIGVGWIFLSATISALLFLLTKSPIALAPLTVATGVTPLLITTIFRYLFWGPDDYRLEMLRLTLKARVKEAKYSHKSRRPKE